jgi:oligosaccharyltransferase complex subunit alpha (ribophorin I)
MISVRILLTLAFALSCVFAIPHQFENTKVIRVIDIKSGIAREDVGIRAKNIDKAPASEYFFYLPVVISNSTASITAFLRKQKTDLPVTLHVEDVAK